MTGRETAVPAEESSLAVGEGVCKIAVRRNISGPKAPIQTLHQGGHDFSIEHCFTCQK
jgi:hypothetical protein